MFEIELRKESIRLALRLREGHSWLEAANQCQIVPVIAEVIHDIRREQVDLSPGGKHSAEIEGIRQHSHNGHRRIAQVDRPSDDTAVASKVPLPERIT